MKNILFAILLMTSCIATSQNNLDHEQLKKVYGKVVEGELCQQDLGACKEVSASLQGIIIDLRNQVKDATAKLAELEKEKAALYTKQQQNAVDVTKAKINTSRLGIGVSVGVDVYGKPNLVGGVSYNLIRL